LVQNLLIKLSNKAIVNNLLLKLKVSCLQLYEDFIFLNFIIFPEFFKEFIAEVEKLLLEFFVKGLFVFKLILLVSE
jgi:hypothetical protein